MESLMLNKTVMMEIIHRYNWRGNKVLSGRKDLPLFWTWKLSLFRISCKTRRSSNILRLATEQLEHESLQIYLCSRLDTWSSRWAPCWGYGGTRCSEGGCRDSWHRRQNRDPPRDEVSAGTWYSPDQPSLQTGDQDQVLGLQQETDRPPSGGEVCLHVSIPGSEAVIHLSAEVRRVESGTWGPGGLTEITLWGVCVT